MFILTYWRASHSSFSRDFYASVYRRLALLFDLVPQTEMGLMTEDMLQSLNTLVVTLREQGQDELAQRIENWILENTP
ncbi:MAG: hypothetical protein P8Z42_15905, partial [Anaerolineales bacterium]